MSVVPLKLPPTFAVLDVETTGFNPTAQIVQIAILDQDGAVLLDTLVKPSIAIPQSASEIHGITDDLVKDAPSFEDIYPQIAKIFDGVELIAAYNSDFDRRILGQDCLRTGNLPLINSWFCAMKGYANKSPKRKFQGKGRGFKWFKLEDACGHWGIEIEGAHGALADCKATLALIKLMQKGFVQDE